MNLLEGFEKLIDERGSAAILRERISLANDKYTLLERENEMLKTENATLKSTCADFKTENQSLHTNLEKAEIKIKNFESRKMTQVSVIRS